MQPPATAGVVTKHWLASVDISIRLGHWVGGDLTTRARSTRLLKVALPLAFSLAVCAVCPAQTPMGNDGGFIPPPPPPPPPLTDDRIFGVIPNYQTVNDPQLSVPPLTVGQKFTLFFKETVDPFTIASAGAGAAMSQAGNDDPKYGQGSGPYAQRFGAALADITTQNFFSDAVLSSILHEDPRYYRQGPAFHFWHRVGYAVSRVFVGRTDSGKTIFNNSNIIGMAMGIGLSNAYYPPRSVNAAEMGSRLGTSLVASALSNILPEFWPDIRQKIFHRK